MSQVLTHTEVNQDWKEVACFTCKNFSLENYKPVHLSDHFQHCLLRLRGL